MFWGRPHIKKLNSDDNPTLKNEALGSTPDLKNLNVGLGKNSRVELSHAIYYFTELFSVSASFIKLKMIKQKLTNTSKKLLETLQSPLQAGSYSSRTYGGKVTLEYHYRTCK